MFTKKLSLSECSRIFLDKKGLLEQCELDEESLFFC